MTFKSASQRKAVMAKLSKNYYKAGKTTFTTLSAKDVYADVYAEQGIKLKKDFIIVKDKELYFKKVGKDTKDFADSIKPVTVKRLRKNILDKIQKDWDQLGGKMNTFGEEPNEAAVIKMINKTPKDRLLILNEKLRTKKIWNIKRF